AGPQYVGVLLRVGGQPQVVQAEVAVEQIAGADHQVGAGADVAEVLAATLDGDGGVEPAAEPQVVHALPHPPGEVGRGGHAGVRDAAGERLGDDAVGDLVDAVRGVELLGQAPLE